MPDQLAIKANASIGSVFVSAIWVHAFRNQEPNGLAMHNEVACSNRSCPRSVRDAGAEEKASGPDHKLRHAWPCEIPRTGCSRKRLRPLPAPTAGARSRPTPHKPTTHTSRHAVVSLNPVQNPGHV